MRMKTVQVSILRGARLIMSQVIIVVLCIIYSDTGYSLPLGFVKAEDGKESPVSYICKPLHKL